MRRMIARLPLYLCLMLIVTGASVAGGIEIRKLIDRKNQLAIMADFEERQERLSKIQSTDHHYTGRIGYIYDADFSDGDTIAILTVERLGIRVAVTEGTDRETLRVSAGHFDGTDMPGAGNFAIAGHSSRIYTCLFNDLHRAEVGDIMDIRTTAGTRHYIISSLTVVEPDEVGVLDHTNESIVTVVTCTNDGAERLVVRAIETQIEN